MLDLLGVFHTTEDEVVVLGAVELGAEALDVVHNGLAGHKEVGDIVVGAQQIRAEVRLEVGGSLCSDRSPDTLSSSV